MLAPRAQTLQLEALPLRVFLVAVGGLGALAGATGLAENALFAQPSNLKYALTVAAPVVIVLAAVARDPLTVLFPLVAVAAPFAGFAATFYGTRVSMLLPILIAAVGAAIASNSRPRGLSSTGIAVVPALLLLAIPFADGINHGRYLVIVAAMIAIAWVTSAAGSLPGGLRLVLWSVVASASIQASIAVWEAHSGHLLNLYSSAGSTVFGPAYFFAFGNENRPTGSLYDPISLGNVLAIACPLALILLVSARAWVERALALSAAVLIGVALLLSLSRTSWIGALAGVLVAIVASPSGIRWRAAGVGAAAAIAVVVISVGVLHGSLDQRFSSIFHPTSANVRTAQGDRLRFELWHAAVGTFEQHPVAGVGLGRLLPALNRRVGDLGTQSHAHSTYFQVLGEAGLAGALAILILIAGLGRDLADGLRRQRVYAAALAGALVAILIPWVTDYTIRYVPVAGTLALVFGAIASLGARKRFA